MIFSPVAAAERTPKHGGREGPGSARARSGAVNTGPNRGMAPRGRRIGLAFRKPEGGPEAGKIINHPARKSADLPGIPRGATAEWLIIFGASEIGVQVYQTRDAIRYPKRASRNPPRMGMRSNPSGDTAPPLRERR